MLPNPPSNAHDEAMGSMSLRDMQIPTSEKINYWPPPSQILATPLQDSPWRAPFDIVKTRGRLSVPFYAKFLIAIPEHKYTCMYTTTEIERFSNFFKQSPMIYSIISL